MIHKDCKKMVKIMAAKVSVLKSTRVRIIEWFSMSTTQWCYCSVVARLIDYFSTSLPKNSWEKCKIAFGLLKIKDPFFSNISSLIIFSWLKLIKNLHIFVFPVACTINIYNCRFYDRKLRSSWEHKLRPYDCNPSYG